MLHQGLWNGWIIASKKRICWTIFNSILTYGSEQSGFLAETFGVTRLDRIQVHILMNALDRNTDGGTVTALVGTPNSGVGSTRKKRSRTAEHLAGGGDGLASSLE